MFVLLYDDAAEEDLRGLRIYEVRRILNEVDAQLSKTPTMRSRRKKLLEGWHLLGTAFARSGNSGSGTSACSTMSTPSGNRSLSGRAAARAPRPRRRSYEGRRCRRSQQLPRVIRRRCSGGA